MEEIIEDLSIRHSEASAVRILVADGRREVRSALRLILEQDVGIIVLAEAANSADVVKQVGMTCPDVIILDCDLPGLDAGELLPTVRSVSPGIWVVALCARSEVRQAALSAGADAFMSKVEPPQKLLSIIRQGFKGRVSGGYGSRTGR